MTTKAPDFVAQGVSGALFSPNRLHRYWLWRTWSPADKPLVFIGLNPSTADEVKNDPTVERMVRRAREYGHGGLIVVNLFAFRAVNPEDMLDSHEAGIDIVGMDNDAAIVYAARSAGTVVCGWGAHGTYMGRGRDVLNLLSDQPHADGSLTHLGLTKTGQPRHPLYISYRVKPQPWRTP